MIRILEIGIELDFFFFFSRKKRFFFCRWYNYRRPAVGSGGGFRIATSSLLTQELLAGKVKAFKGASLALPFLVFPRLDIEFVSTQRERERDVRGSAAERVGSGRRSGGGRGGAAGVSDMERQQREYCTLFFFFFFFSVANLGFLFPFLMSLLSGARG